VLTFNRVVLYVQQSCIWEKYLQIFLKNFFAVGTVNDVITGRLNC
jgi:hypothetical protein